MSEPTPRQSSPALSNLNCQQVTDVLIDYVSGDMSPDMTARLERHLHACQDCQAFFNTYRETVRATRSLAAETVPGELLSRVWHFLRQST